MSYNTQNATSVGSNESRKHWATEAATVLLDAEKDSSTQVEKIVEEISFTKLEVVSNVFVYFGHEEEKRPTYLKILDPKNQHYWI